MIEPDLTNRQPCCDAMQPGHYSDCPTAVEREAALEDERTRAVRSLMHAVGVSCGCHHCIGAVNG